MNDGVGPVMQLPARSLWRTQRVLFNKITLSNNMNYKFYMEEVLILEVDMRDWILLNKNVEYK